MTLNSKTTTHEQDNVNEYNRVEKQVQLVTVSWKNQVKVKGIHSTLLM